MGGPKKTKGLIYSIHEKYRYINIPLISRYLLCMNIEKSWTVVYQEAKHTIFVYTFAQLNRPFWDDLPVQRQRYHAHFKCAKV